MKFVRWNIFELQPMTHNWYCHIGSSTSLIQHIDMIDRGYSRDFRIENQNNLINELRQSRQVVTSWCHNISDAFILGYFVNETRTYVCSKKTKRDRSSLIIRRPCLRRDVGLREKEYWYGFRHLVLIKRSGYTSFIFSILFLKTGLSPRFI